MKPLSQDGVICRVIKRDILESERGTVSTFNELPAWMVEEARMVARESLVSAGRYLRFFVARDHASHAEDFIEEVLLKGEDAGTWRIQDCLVIPDEPIETTALEMHYVDSFQGMPGERWFRAKLKPTDDEYDYIPGVVGIVLRKTRYWGQVPPGFVRFRFAGPDDIEVVPPDRLESSVRRWIARRLAWWARAGLRRPAVTGDELIAAVPEVDLSRVTPDARIAAAALAREAQAFGDSPSFPQQAGFLGPEEWYQ